MMQRRTFFSKCAAFVAGCALGVGIQRKAAGKWIPNPEWEKATHTLFDPEHFCTAFVMQDGKLWTMRDGKWDPVKA